MMVTAAFLVENYIRLSPTWLRNNGLYAYFKVMYRKRDDDSEYLICLSRPKKRRGETRDKDWIASITGMNVLKTVKPNTKAFFFLTDENFDWALADYPEQCHICAGGFTRNVFQMIDEINGMDNLLIRGRVPVVFFGEDFLPKTERGVCPDSVKPILSDNPDNHSKIIIHELGGRTHRLYMIRESELGSVLDVLYKFCAIGHGLERNLE